MIWLFKRRPRDEPQIPPAADVDIDPEASARMEEIVTVRARRGQWVTRHTQHAIAQNHFAQNMQKAMEGR